MIEIAVVAIIAFAAFAAIRRILTGEGRHERSRNGDGASNDGPGHGQSHCANDGDGSGGSSGGDGGD